MKSLFFGPAFYNHMVSPREVIGSFKSLVFNNGSSPAHGCYVAGGPNGHFKIDVYDGDFMDLENSEVLITFEINGFSEDRINSGASTKLTERGLQIIFGCAPSGSVASASGIAKWFKYYNSTNPDVSILGTIGNIGTDADLIIPETTILEGQLYRNYGAKMFIGNTLEILGS
jgi:hypothetical protein